MTNKQKVEIIEKLVAESFGITIAAMHERRRHRGIVEPRQFAMRLMTIYTNMTAVGIGAMFGMDHSTVCHACNTVEELIRWNGREAKWKELNAAISARIGAEQQREHGRLNNLPNYFLKTVR